METVNCATCKALVWEADVPVKATGNCWRCEVKRLQRALRNIAETCIEDPETAQFAAYAVDGAAHPPPPEVVPIARGRVAVFPDGTRVDADELVQLREQLADTHEAFKRFAGWADNPAGDALVDSEVRMVRLWREPRHQVKPKESAERKRTEHLVAALRECEGYLLGTWGTNRDDVLDVIAVALADEKETEA